MVFQDFPGPFYVHFLGLSRTIYVCPLLFSFPDCIIKWILNKSDLHVHLLNQLMKAQNMWHITLNSEYVTVHNYAMQQIKVCTCLKCTNHLVYLPGPRRESVTFQAWKN